MIKSFRDKGLQRFFESGDSRRLKVSNNKRVARMLRALDAASAPDDLNLPGLRFHALVGDLKGRFAITVTGNWRITFGWSDKDAVDVTLEDYH